LNANAAVAPLPTLDGLRLADALRAGIYRLFARTDHLNRINVFPVPDGDTGTNMAMTMSAVLTAIERSANAHAGRLLVGVADAAIDGARGNSGAILAQFLLGLADRAGHLAALTAPEFAAAAHGGATYARDALTQPREGTLLTVLTEVAKEFERLVHGEAVRDFAQLLQRALPRARDAVERTRGQLDVLRAANVVDAGAQGFVEILEGMSSYLDSGEVGEAIEPQHGGEEAMAVGGSEGEHRYCTECVVNGEGVDRRRLREVLSAMGSSLVVAGTNRKARIHIHTNEPAQVFDAAARFGTLSAQKADDMHRQTTAAHHGTARRVAVVTDSAGDIPEEVLERLDVHIVPLRVHFGDRGYLDKVSLSAEEFYRELATSAVHPKTSQPPPGDFRRVYEFLASHFDHVVSISLSSRVSGTFQAARGAAERIAGQKVTVIDSGNASLGQGLLAMYAAECALAGLDGAAVAAATEAMRLRTRTFGLLAGLDYAVRGGRVKPFVRSVSKVLRLAPVLTNRADGRIAPGGAIFGGGDLVPRFARYIAKRLPKGVPQRLAVGHADAEREGRRLLDALRALVPQVESSYLTPLGTALGVHGGPGMLVVGAQEYPAPPGPALTSGRK
jgi:hypothetical protein